MGKLLFALLFAILTAGASAQSLKVMTYNLRYDNPGDGVNQWDKRKKKVFDLIKKQDPDIIGVQEALHHQLTDIKEALPQYDFFGVGRDDGKQKGEYSAVFIRRKRLKVMEDSTFWLSETPRVPGSKSWDAAITRVVTWGKLKDRRSGKSFFMVNTHFDHRGKESRKQSARLLKDSVTAMSRELPVIITGDFNFTRDQPPFEVLMDENGTRLYDTAPSGAPGTSCGFEVGARPCNGIDYIFHTAGWNASGYQVIQDNDGKYYPSDHLPVTVTLTINR